MIAHPLFLIAASGFSLPHVNYTTILPELILLGGMLFLLGVSALSTRQPPTEVYATLTAGISVAALVSSLFLWDDVRVHGSFLAIDRSLDVDGFAVAILVLSSSVLVVASLLGASYLRRDGIAGCEYYALALISGAGAMLMGSANDLILIFIALEVLSIPLYVMAGFDRRRESSSEAAMKYFVLGAFSSAIFVYGIALTYGATGSTNLTEIAAFLSRNVVTSNGVLLGGLALLLVGFAFKVAAVPFHMWTPDVYVGAPSSATGFMAAIAKVGGFAALLRVFVSSFPTLRSNWQPIIYVLAAVTLLLGAIVALAQRDVKRMLAYSSINHAGFVLLGLQAASAAGVAASLYYVFIYSFLVLGTFAVVGVLAGRGDIRHDLEDYRGLARRAPVLSTVLALLLLAQAGVPFTTGFFAKLYVIEAAVDAHSYALAAIAMLSGAIAAFFYLRIVFVMFGAGEIAEASAVQMVGGGGVLSAVAADAVAISPFTAVALALTLGTTLVFGIWPGPLIAFAHQATLLF